MSQMTRTSLLGALVLLSSACSQQEPPVAAEVPAPAPATAVSEQPAVQSPEVTGMQTLSAEQIAETRPNYLGSCNIESINGKALATGGSVSVAPSVVKVGGWFFPESTKATGSPASLRLVNEAATSGWDFSITNWMPRPDVNASKNSADEGNAGFSQEVDLSSLAPGAYNVSVVFGTGEGKFTCNHPKQIIVE